MPTEPPIDGLVDALASAGRTILLPRPEDDGSLTWVTRGTARGTAEITLHPRLKVPVPVGESVSADGGETGTSPIAACSLILIPALAATVDGRRLGQGGGYYDRALGNVDAMRIAVVWDDEVLADVPVEPHDQMVDAILTPMRFIQVDSTRVDSARVDS